MVNHHCRAGRRPPARSSHLGHLLFSAAGPSSARNPSGCPVLPSLCCVGWPGVCSHAEKYTLCGLHSISPVLSPYVQRCPHVALAVARIEEWGERSLQQRCTAWLFIPTRGEGMRHAAVQGNDMVVKLLGVLSTFC